MIFVLWHNYDGSFIEEFEDTKSDSYTLKPDKEGIT